MNLTRPIVRYHGGKWRLAPHIIAYFPQHRVYVEPFGGGGSILLRKPRCYAEVYNDLDGEMVNVFRVVRDRGPELRNLLKATPFARDEYNGAFTLTEDTMEMARKTIIRSFMGFGSNAIRMAVRSGFRANSNRSGTTPAHDWANYPDCLEALTDRLRGVVLENTDAMRVMLQQDSEDALHYCDPPYVHATRTASGSGYNHEMTDAQHFEFLEGIQSLKGSVIVSGYAHDLYENALSDWMRIEIAALADGARPRIEVLWLNDAAQRHQQRGLFA